MNEAFKNSVNVAAASGYCVLSARVTFINQTLAQPFVLSSGTISVLTDARAEVVVVDAGGGETVGYGSIYLSDLWAWPDPDLSHAHRDGLLRELCEWISARLAALTGDAASHPLELGLRLHNHVCESPIDSVFEGIPALALAMCASPFDAAIHDAVGKALNVCAMRLYDGEPVETSADAWFEQGGACAAISRMLASTPTNQFDAWFIVGKGDDLKRDVRPWFKERGYRCFKLKLHGRDVSEDLARTVEMYEAAVSWGAVPRLSIDTNEACADAAFVLEFLRRLQQTHVEAFIALEYLEQPTARDIAEHPFNWKEVTQLKPVLLDEGLTSLDRLPLCLEQGWSGLALKTCKGHSFALVAAAWAHENGLTLALQDLTNPGWAGVHAALFAAWIPTINGVELNSPQFTPDANLGFLQEWSGIFDVQDGLHHLAKTEPLGLGATIEVK